MREFLLKLAMLGLVIIMELLLVNWDTNQFLKKWDKPISIEEATRHNQGRRVNGTLETVTTKEQIEALEWNAAFFFQAKELKPTGIYRLLREEYEGITGVGKSKNIFPRKMFTTGTFLSKVYRGMYGQFYEATLSDGSNVLVLIGCNDEKEFIKKGYSDVLTIYHDTLGEKGKSDWETDELLQQTKERMDISGYLDLSDDSWANRHDFGLFVMNMVKLIISILGATIIYLFLPVKESKIDKNQDM